MCTPQSFPPTPGARSFVMARSEDLLFVACDQLVKVYVTDLESETMYCVRLRAVGLKNGMSEHSDVVTVVTEKEPENEWEVIGTRRLKEVHRGRGDASVVLSRPHIHPDVETLGGTRERTQKPSTPLTRRLEWPLVPGWEQRWLNLGEASRARAEMQCTTYSCSAE